MGTAVVGHVDVELVVGRKRVVAHLDGIDLVHGRVVQGVKVLERMASGEVGHVRHISHVGDVRAIGGVVSVL